MGKRINKVYTRTGDDGTTAVSMGGRIGKDSLLIHAIGDIDELNAAIGLLRSEDLHTDIDPCLERIQNELFSIGGEISMPQYQSIQTSHIDRLEQKIDKLNKDLQPLDEFILPAGNRAVAQCHMARTVCRRAERSLIALPGEVPMRDEIKQYINRLSDLLFVLARAIGKQSGVTEVYWKKY